MEFRLKELQDKRSKKALYNWRESAYIKDQTRQTAKGAGRNTSKRKGRLLNWADDKTLHSSKKVPSKEQQVDVLYEKKV
jgi:hypothetical protein